MGRQGKGGCDLRSRRFNGSIVFFTTLQATHRGKGMFFWDRWKEESLDCKFLRSHPGKKHGKVGGKAGEGRSLSRPKSVMIICDYIIEAINQSITRD